MMSSPLKYENTPLSPDLSGSGPLQGLHDYLSADMAAVNDMIIARLQSPVDEIPKVARYLIESGGKRIRPLLTLGCAALFRAPEARAYQLATAVEFIHSATLLHDDVVDESDTRRGKCTANLVYGNQVAVLVGDFLFSRAFELMVETRSLDVLELLSRASCIIAEGEVMQLATTRKLDTPLEDYLGIISAKTAALFAAAAASGPSLYDATRSERDALYQYGHHLGVAFQIADDILDYTGDQNNTGKSCGNDFSEGKITAPVIFALGHAGATERAFWQKTLVDHDISDGDFSHAVEYLHTHDAFSKAHHLAEEQAKMAMDSLSSLPDHPIKDILADLAIFAARREK